MFLRPCIRFPAQKNGQNLHLLNTLMRALREAFQVVNGCAAHSSGQALMSEGQIYSHSRSFTSTGSGDDAPVRQLSLESGRCPPRRRSRISGHAGPAPSWRVPAPAAAAAASTSPLKGGDKKEHGCSPRWTYAQVPCQMNLSSRKKHGLEESTPPQTHSSFVKDLLAVSVMARGVSIRRMASRQDA
jgi:hypothetical protein